MKKPLIIIIICAVIASAVILFLLFGFNYAGDSNQQTNAAGSTEAGSTPGEAVTDYETVDFEELMNADHTDTYYQSIVNTLKTQRKAGWTDTSPEDYGLSDVFADQNLKCCYAIEDIDQDGINELYLGTADGDSMKIYQIFTAPDNVDRVLYCSYSTGGYMTLTEDGIFLTAAAVETVNMQTDSESESVPETMDPASLDEEEISYIELHYRVKYVDGAFVPEEEEESDSADETSETTASEEKAECGAYILSEGVFENTDLPEKVTAKKISAVLIDE